MCDKNNFLIILYNKKKQQNNAKTDNKLYDGEE